MGDVFDFGTYGNRVFIRRLAERLGERLKCYAGGECHVKEEERPEECGRYCLVIRPNVGPGPSSRVIDIYIEGVEELPGGEVAVIHGRCISMPGYSPGPECVFYETGPGYEKAEKLKQLVEAITEAMKEAAVMLTPA